MGNHFKPLSVESGLFDKQVGDRGLGVIIDDLLPPGAGNSITFQGDKELGIRAGAVQMATETGVNYFLCLCPQVLIGDVLETKIQDLVLDGNTGGAVVRGETGADRLEEESESALGCARGTKTGPERPLWKY